MWLKLSLEIGIPMQSANPFIIGQKKRSPEIPNPVLAINRYERVLSIHVCLSLRDDRPRLDLNTETDASI